ncbi:MAG: DNA recombination protein RmuC, partial [Acutalibacteraceae bacterium]|nr:DNA recombination protein RmuC [Acutalibacteraceae bacterium]
DRKTLNERLDSSFKTVSEQLEKLYESLGKMKNLSDGVNDLQRLLTNVKARGTWAEVQLGEILEQFLTADQYDVNVSTKNNSERVEFAVKIPSRDKEGTFIWLPIDSKFPQEDYLRLQAAADRCDKIAVEESEKALAKIIKDEAATISRLYINVPKTTNFAIMFLPTEGLYAEVLRQNGLVEEIQRKYSVMICGPTTISAFLNTLRVGFRTIAIDKQQAEVWKILGAAKQQYATFETVLENAEKKINEAGNVLSDARKRNGIIQRKLNKVEDISQADSNEILGIEEG